MTNILLLLAVAGIIVGVYAVAMPTLTRKGWRLPFAGFFSDAEEEDEPFTPAFGMPRPGEAPIAIAIPSPGAELPVEEVEETALPPVLRPADLDEDDPTLAPLFEELTAEVEQAPVAEPAAIESPDVPVSQPPHIVIASSQAIEVVQTPENAAPPPAADEPQEPEAAKDDMMALFAESADAGKGPNLIREAVGEVTIEDLMEEVRKLREILDKRAA
jgi:hypothetical protein